MARPYVPRYRGSVLSARSYMRNPYGSRRTNYYRRASGVRYGKGFYQRGGRFQMTGRNQVEKHWLQLAQAEQAIDTTMETVNDSLVTIAQSDGVDGRTGSKICLLKIAFRGILYTKDVNAQNYANSQVKFWLIQDTQCNGAAATVTSATAGIFTSTGAREAFLTPYTYGRFRVLMSKTMSLTAPTYWDTGSSNNFFAQTSKPIYMAWKAKPNKGIVIEYNGTSGVIGQRVSNNVFLVAGAYEDDDLLYFSGNYFVEWLDCA